MNLEELQSKINNIKVIENGEEELIGKVKDLRDYFIYNLAYSLLAENERDTEYYINKRYIRAIRRIWRKRYIKNRI